MSTRFERFVASFNERRLDEAIGETTHDYTYSDPLSGTLRGKDAHLKYMQQVLEAYPDRAIEILAVWSAGEVEFAEYRWRGTPVASGDKLDLPWAVVVEYHEGLLRRQRHYRG